MISGLSGFRWAFALAIALTASVFAQGQDATAVISQVEYQQAKSAEVIQQDNSVMIITQGLQNGIKQGAFVTIESAQEVKYAWLFADKQPPAVIRPFKPNVFLVTGTPGQKVYLGLGFDIPEVIEVTIGQPTQGPDSPVNPPVKPPVNPPGNSAAIKKAVSDAATSTNDAVTANDLAEAYAKAITAMDDTMTVDQCKSISARARANILGRGTFVGDWNRVLLDADRQFNALNPQTAKDYRAAMVSVVEGLREAVDRIAGLKPKRVGQTHKSLPALSVLAKQWAVSA